MKASNDSSQQWEVCPPGLIQETAKLKGPGTGLGRWIGVTLAILVVACITWFNQKSAPEKIVKEPLVVDCQTVRQHLVSYAKGEIEDGEFALSIDWHLRRCECCLTLYKKVCCKLKRKQAEVILKPECEVRELKNRCPLPAP